MGTSETEVVGRDCGGVRVETPKGPVSQGYVRAAEAVLKFLRDTKVGYATRVAHPEKLGEGGIGEGEESGPGPL